MTGDGVEPGAQAAWIVEFVNQAEGAEEGLLKGVVDFRFDKGVLTAQRSHHRCVALIDPGKGFVRRCAKGRLNAGVENDPNVRGVVGHSGRNGRRGQVVSGRLAHSEVVPITRLGGPRMRESGNGVTQPETA